MFSPPPFFKIVIDLSIYSCLMRQARTLPDFSLWSKMICLRLNKLAAALEAVISLNWARNNSHSWCNLGQGLLRWEASLDFNSNINSFCLVFGDFELVKLIMCPLIKALNASHLILAKNKSICPSKNVNSSGFWSHPWSSHFWGSCIQPGSTWTKLFGAWSEIRMLSLTQQL